MDQGDNLLDRAQAALDLGRREEAASFASQAVAKAPDDAAGHVMLAWTLLTVDDKAALASAERAIALAPDGPSGFDVGAVAAGNVREKTKAIEYATRFRELRPQWARSHRRYAGAVHDFGRHKQRHDALAAAEEAVRLDPHNPANFNELARIQQYAMNDETAARTSLNQALQVDPLNTYAKRQLAYASEEDGDKASALSTVQSVIRLDPSDQHARKQLDDIVIGFMADLLWATFVLCFIAWFVLVIALGSGAS